MNCDELDGHYELYVLGLAEEDESREIRQHLDRGCEVCMRELSRARELAAMVGGTAVIAAPPAALRRRILASVGVEARRLGWWAPVWGVAAVTSLAVAAFVALFFRGREVDLAQQLVDSREQVRNQTIELTRLTEAFAILNGPDTTEASFGKGPQQPPKGRVFVNPAQGVLLIASNLPPAPNGKTYEMWLLPKRGMPMPAGLFQSQNDGTALYVRRGTVNLNGTNAVAVTLENAAGAPQPTVQPLIVAALPSNS